MSVQLELNSNNLQNSLLKRYMQADSIGMRHAKAILKEQHEGNINNLINTTTDYKNGGRVSFSGDAKVDAVNFAEKLVKRKWFEKFCIMAQQNSAVAEAVGALFITCGLRPMAIMAMPQKDVDKNRKAASHSIASGVTGLVFAKIAYEPFSLAMKKIKAAMEAGEGRKYLGNAVDYLKEVADPDKVKVAINGAKKKATNWDCFNQLVTYGPKVVTASILAAFTVGTMPYIDKYIIDKYILKKKPEKDEKPVFTTYDHFKYITFKSTPSGEEVFQNFKGALK